MEKEEKAFVLDYLPYGYPLDRRMMAVAQAIGTKFLTLLELIPRRGIKLEVREEVYIGEGKRDKVYYIQGRLSENKLTETARKELEEFINKLVSQDTKRFVDFFNTAQAINTRLHQFELLPGFGKKHTEALLNERNKKPFESLRDLKERVANLPDPQRAVEKRLFEEIAGKERYLLFLK